MRSLSWPKWTGQSQIARKDAAVDTMDAVFNYEIPALHPLAVHFPLALILASALTALVWSYRGSAFWRQSTLLLMVLGSAGAAFAYFTGDTMREQSEGVPIIEELVDLHEDMGLYTFIASMVATAALAGLSLARRRAGTDDAERDPILLRIAIACLVLMAAALVAWTAHVGATMTWGVVP